MTKCVDCGKFTQAREDMTARLRKEVALAAAIKANPRAVWRGIWRKK